MPSHRWLFYRLFVFNDPDQRTLWLLGQFPKASRDHKGQLTAALLQRLRSMRQGGLRRRADSGQIRNGLSIARRPLSNNTSCHGEIGITTFKIFP